MDTIAQIWDLMVRAATEVIEYPTTPKERIYGGYLFTSLLFAAYVFWRGSASDIPASGNIVQRFFQFLFPKSVWSQSSAWLDVRYFIPHQMVRVFIYGSLLTFTYIEMRGFSSGLLRETFEMKSLTRLSSRDLWFVVLYSLVLFGICDFAMFVVHYLQHKVPFLWEFHKVHHSATVMHPLTNYREHPIDNIFYAVVLGACYGITFALFHFGFGLLPVDLKTPLFGVSAVTFAFNVLGYNLRHSHIWVRWPGKLAMAFGSPAHHQIHHSCKPEHIDKNFAFIFPVWDVIFGTYVLPEKRPEIVYGLGDGTEAEYRSFLTLYFLPFIKVARLVRKGKALKHDVVIATASEDKDAA